MLQQQMKLRYVGASGMQSSRLCSDSCANKFPGSRMCDMQSLLVCTIAGCELLCVCKQGPMPASALRMMSSQSLYGPFASSDPSYKISPGMYVYRLLQARISDQADMQRSKPCQVSAMCGSSNSRHASSFAKPSLGRWSTLIKHTWAHAISRQPNVQSQQPHSRLALLLQFSTCHASADTLQLTFTLKASSVP